MGDPNRVSQKNVSHDTEERDLVCGTGDVKKDGYTRLARRPRSRFADDIMPNSDADSVESPTMGYPISWD